MVHTHAKRPIACVSSVTRAGETSFSVVTSCTAMAVVSAFDTFVDICSHNWRKPDTAQSRTVKIHSSLQQFVTLTIFQLISVASVQHII